MGICRAQGGGKQERKERKNEFGEERQKRFLAAFASTCNLSAACAEVGIDRSTVFLRRRSDREFKAAFEAAREQAVVHLESELIRRGIELVEAATPEESDRAMFAGMDAKFLLSLLEAHRRNLGKEAGHASDQRSDPGEAAARLHALMVRLRAERKVALERQRRAKAAARAARANDAS